MPKGLFFLLIPLALVGIIGTRLVVKNNQSSDAAPSAETKNLRHLSMQIDGMYCAACPYNVEKALSDLSGVANVTVGFVGKEIVNGTVAGQGEVIYDSSKINLYQMIQAILPYKGVVLSDETTPSTELAPLAKTFGL